MPPDGRPVCSTQAESRRSPAASTTTPSSTALRRPDRRVAASTWLVERSAAPVDPAAPAAPRSRRGGLFAYTAASIVARPRAARLDLRPCPSAPTIDPGLPGTRLRGAGRGPPAVDRCSACSARCASCARPGRRRLLHVPPPVHRRRDGPRRPDGRRLGGVPVHPRAPGAGVPALVRDPRQPLRAGHRGRRRRPRPRGSSPALLGATSLTSGAGFVATISGILVLTVVTTAMAAVTRHPPRRAVAARRSWSVLIGAVRPDHRPRGRARVGPLPGLPRGRLVDAARHRGLRPGRLEQRPDAGRRDAADGPVQPAEGFERRLEARPRARCAVA